MKETSTNNCEGSLKIFTEIYKIELPEEFKEGINNGLKSYIENIAKYVYILDNIKDINYYKECLEMLLKDINRQQNQQIELLNKYTTKATME